MWNKKCDQCTKDFTSRIEYINHIGRICYATQIKNAESPKDDVSSQSTQPTDTSDVTHEDTSGNEEALFMVINMHDMDQLNDDQLIDIVMDDHSNEERGPSGAMFQDSEVVAEETINGHEERGPDMIVLAEASEPTQTANLEHVNTPVQEDEDLLHTAAVHNDPEAVERTIEVPNKGFTKKGLPRKRAAPKDKSMIQSKLQKCKDKHLLKAPCDVDKCKRKCSTKLTEERRKSIHKQFWTLENKERQVFVLSNVNRTLVARRTIEPDANNLKRERTFLYTLTNEKGETVQVCKTFFLTTLGYEKHNDRAFFNILNQPLGSISPKPDMRGKHPPHNRVDKTIIQDHIMIFNPCVHHYRSEHAPNRLYLPTDINVKLMHDDFLLKYPSLKYSYDLYRSVVSDMKISFTKLGHEECERCEIYNKHNSEHAKEADESCEVCTRYLEHKTKYQEARTFYQKAVSKENGEVLGPNDTVVYSMDLQKVIMLPMIEEFKECIFTKRIIVLNESFVPIGERTDQPEIQPIACLWHEGVSGRKKEDICSAIHKFIVCNRDAKKIVLWMDNCAAQNKNWALFSHMVSFVNSEEIATDIIEFNYLEPGHTYMSADSFHHQVAKQMKTKGKIYDFHDFTDAVQKSNSKKVTVCPLEYTDFFLEFDHSSVNKITKTKPRPYLANMVQVSFKRGSFNMVYKNSFEGEEITLDFLKVALIKRQKIPTVQKRNSPRGICQSKKKDIIDKLIPLMPNNRKDFWLNIPVTNVVDLITDFDE